MLRTSCVVTLTFVCLVSAETIAQPYAAEKVAGIEGDHLARPLWSPDGRYIAFTGEENRGINLLNMETREVRQVTDAYGAGFGFSWSPDGGSILARVTERDGIRSRHAVQLFDVETGQAQRMTEFREQMPVLPAWTADGSAVVLHHRGQPEVFPVEAPAPRGEAVYLRNDRVFVADAATRSVEPLEIMPGATILNLVRSADGSRIAFEVMGGNIFAANADGSGLVDLGSGNRPQFSPDGIRIVFMLAEDDGHRYTHSDLYVVNVDGSGRRNVTNSHDRLEMNPSWAPDGRRIAFDAYDEGAIYVMTLDE